MKRLETPGTAFYFSPCTRSQDNKNLKNDPSSAYDDTLRNQGVFMKNGFVEILFFPVIRLFSAAARRVTPSLPQRGRQHVGSILLPLLLLRFFINLLMIIALLGDDESGGSGSTM
jgi:hypothetical protein